MSKPTNTEKSLEKNLGGEANQGASGDINNRGFGEMNNLRGKSSGQTHDPGRKSANDVFSQAATDQTSPDLLGDMVGRWKAVVLSKEELCLAPLSSDIELNEGEATLPIMTIRARIPELDSMLPNPRDLVNELGKNSSDSKLIINLHRRFQASSVSQYTPSPGDVVYIDLLDMDDIDNAGIYVDNLFDAPVGGGAVGVGGNGSAKLFDKASGRALIPATGDALAGLSVSAGASQTPILLGGEFDEGFDPSKIEPPPALAAGKYMTYVAKGRGNPPGPGGITSKPYGENPNNPPYRKAGEIKLTNWPNKSRKNQPVPTSAYPYLKLLDNAMPIGLSLVVRSGFRTMADQEYFWGRYLQQIEDRKTGKRIKRATPAAYPGRSNHQGGRAFDLAYYDGSKEIGFEQDLEMMKWMIANAPKYGIIWEEGKYIKEPWHWNFDINKAPPIQSGVTPDPDPSEGQSLVEDGVEEEPLDQEQSIGVS